MKGDLPIACLLTDQELKKRRKTVLEKVSRSLLEVRELANGFRYDFPLEDSIFEDLAALINLERKCCPFLNFNLILEAQSEVISLELRGQEGTKEMLKTLFRWN